MGLIKLIILIILIVACLTLWRRIQAWHAANQAPSADPTKPPLMVRCQHCQLHLPQDQALQSGEYWYCCHEHRDADHE
ncbi:PP0621 family protein [Halopseudomonas salegens]|uniref:MYND finger n=1 Tax=Halopseudomonas salegens TaxID=1434072 RepID=A0A1H2EFP4_9GAMM|nr:PP0621 family protein [Halopseudomonas salegens]SDT93911.1 uncharacterized protein SAMN05216210_0676 [Halopseudomonas salegens]